MIRIQDLLKKKNASEPIVMLTVYDAAFARILDDSGVDILLVGDSLGMVVQGQETTLGVTVEHIVYHTQMVARAAHRAHLVSDMPFMSYQHDVKEALLNAAQLMVAGAHAVKLEGGLRIVPTVQALVESGIPVMGHLGLTPQSVHALSGYKMQGKTEQARKRLLQEALALQEAGAYACVLECIPSDLAGEISQALSIPSIGIGAGPLCDGQVLVLHDMLGLNPEAKPPFAKEYVQGKALVHQACEAYVNEVRQRVFPA
ncbi:MAG: 3-methyl-2-oxobutanoate hydroxymethyltransferase [Myxococcaceae bacterium]|nr:3-methyl-2-oxobutanoate hydroxymethyltransferase [Myxococcaceae bacterium]MBH2005837.1 3-methyl-2-oxobutanoate hydroxymethyltransferase [Myxococcaceae bacterium]